MLSAELGGKYSQANIISTLRAYLEHLAWTSDSIETKKSIQNRGFVMTKGMCNGFATMFLYFHALNKEDEFYKMLDTIIAQKGKISKIPNNPEVKKLFDNFINTLVFVHSPNEFVTGLVQTNLAQTINVIGAASFKKNYNAHHLCSISHCLTKEEFKDILKELNKDGQLEGTSIQINGHNHAIALTVRDGKYILYDPNRTNKVVTENEGVIANLLGEYLFTKSDYIPISMNITAIVKKADPKPNFTFTSPTYQKIANEVNRLGDTGVNPLHMAIRSNNLERVKELIYHGADLHAKAGERELTPLQISLSRGLTEISALLIAAGTEFNRKKLRLAFLDAPPVSYQFVLDNYQFDSALSKIDFILNTMPKHMIAERLEEISFELSPEQINDGLKTLMIRDIPEMILPYWRKFNPTQNESLNKNFIMYVLMAEPEKTELCDAMLNAGFKLDFHDDREKYIANYVLDKPELLEILIKHNITLYDSEDPDDSPLFRALEYIEMDEKYFDSFIKMIKKEPELFHKKQSDGRTCLDIIINDYGNLIDQYPQRFNTVITIAESIQETAKLSKSNSLKQDEVERQKEPKVITTKRDP